MGLFLHQTTTTGITVAAACKLFMGLFLHQTTTLYVLALVIIGCLWVFSYIKPQQGVSYLFHLRVVYGSFPTSNHNIKVTDVSCLRVVYGSFPTSNHNRSRIIARISSLFMGLFLHQTTTRVTVSMYSRSCLWVFSYIKPQRNHRPGCLRRVVYGSFPTSNHNYQLIVLTADQLFMGLFLHQTTTCRRPASCKQRLFMGLFLHQTTTLQPLNIYAIVLFMGLFLHQTTTLPP